MIKIEKHRETIHNIIDELNMAISYINDNHRLFKVNYEKMITLGYSAGAHLALMLSYQQESPIPIKLVIDYAGVTDVSHQDFQDVLEKNSILNNIMKYFDKSASPLNYVNSNSPKTLICHGTLDDTVPYTQSMLLASILSENNVSNYLCTLDGINHSLEGAILDEMNNKIMAELIEFLE